MVLGLLRGKVGYQRYRRLRLSAEDRTVYKCANRTLARHYSPFRFHNTPRGIINHRIFSAQDRIRQALAEGKGTEEVDKILKEELSIGKIDY